MKNKKEKLSIRFLAVLLLMSILLCAVVNVPSVAKNVFAADQQLNSDIQLYSDAESSIYGFNVDDNNFSVKWTRNNYSVNYNGAYCGDITLYLGGVSMKDKLSNGNYGYGVLIYAIITPRAFDLTYESKTHTYRGRSRYFNISTSLSSSQNLLSSSPENVAGSSSYSVGISAGGGSSGIEGAISASTSITKNALEIFNYSNTVEGKVDIRYQYNRHIWPWEWERTKYCWNESVQRASFFFSSPTSISSKTIKTELTFAIDDGDIGMWNLEMGYEVTATRSVTVKY